MKDVWARVVFHSEGAGEVGVGFFFHQSRRKGIINYLEDICGGGCKKEGRKV